MPAYVEEAALVCVFASVLAESQKKGAHTYLIWMKAAYDCNDVCKSEHAGIIPRDAEIILREEEERNVTTRKRSIFVSVSQVEGGLCYTLQFSVSIPLCCARVSREQDV